MEAIIGDPCGNRTRLCNVDPHREINSKRHNGNSYSSELPIHRIAMLTSKGESVDTCAAANACSVK